jgi:SWI/SNF-related matrix-associated actin-dependent regulator of chromatin subfamily A3
MKYRKAELPIVDMLDDALNTEDRYSGTYMHALAKINTLRRLCNLSLTAQGLKVDLENKLRDPDFFIWNSTTAQEAYENLVSLGQASCIRCCTDLDIPFQKGPAPPEDYLRARLTQCLRLICETCFQQLTECPSASICICED